MDKIHIVLLDSDAQMLDIYGKLCRVVCDKLGLLSDVKAYTDAQNLLFDMGDTFFQSTVNIFIVDPDNHNEAVALAIRNVGYNSVILYLTDNASVECCMRAFDARAFNYLHKGPDHLPRFAAVFEKAIQEAVSLRSEYITVSKYGECRRIELKDIYYFESYNGNIIVNYTGGQFEFISTFEELEQQIGDSGFLRVHRSYLVAMAFIKNVSYDRLTLNNGTELPVGRTRYPALKQAVRMGA